ncbi:MAG: AI-2E family transporter [Stellaceae bacterium]
MTAPWQQFLFWAGGLIVLLLLLYLLSPIMLPFVAGGIIAYFLDPAVQWMARGRLPRWLATTIVLALFGLALIVLIALIVPLLRLQATELIRQLPILFAQASTLLDDATRALAKKVPEADVQRLRMALGGSVGDIMSWAIRQVQTLLTSGVALANLLSLVFITPMVAFFLLRDWDRIVAKIDDWLPRDKLDTIREQARLVDAMLAGYIRGQLLVCLALGIYYTAALTAVGLEFGLILGILTGLLTFIPYVGFTTGLALAAGLGLIQFGWGMNFIWVLIIFAIGEVLESSVLSPSLVGQRVQLHPVWVIFALLAFGTLFGILGVLIALPAAAVAGVLVRFALGHYMASPLYRRRGTEPAPFGGELRPVEPELPPAPVRVRAGKRRPAE